MVIEMNGKEKKESENDDMKRDELILVVARKGKKRGIQREKIGKK